MHEVRECRIRPTQLALAEPKAQKLAYVNRGDPTLGLIDRQLQAPAKVRGQAGFDALAGSNALDEHQKIVGIPREAVAPSRQLPIQIIGVTRRLNELGVPTKKHGAQWERSTVWAMLRNPAYKGTACFGKTRTAARERTNNRRLRLRGGLPARNGASHELPREQWIEIAVPALIEEDTFAVAQERLASNKKLASRRTIEPSILQGLVHCRHCGYGLGKA